jgi:hypothetical protein
MVRFERGSASAMAALQGNPCAFLAKEFIISVIIPSGFPAGDLPS